MGPLDIDPRVGDAVCRLVEKMTGRECHIVLIVCPLEQGKLGQPSFVTSLQPQEMEDLVVQIAGGFALAGERIVTGVHRQ